jgi:hypothetical protein
LLFDNKNYMKVLIRVVIVRQCTSGVKYNTIYSTLDELHISNSRAMFRAVLNYTPNKSCRIKKNKEMHESRQNKLNDIRI